MDRRRIRLGLCWAMDRSRVGLGLHWPTEASDAVYKGGSSSSYGGLVEEQTGGELCSRLKLRKLNQRNLAGVIQAQMEDMVVVVVTVIHTVVVVVAVVFLATAVVVAMDTVVATDQLLQHIMAAQHMVPTAEGMDIVVLLLAMAQVMDLHMVAPCMEAHMVPTGHMVVPMEVHMVLQEGMVREDMAATVGLEAWVVVAVLVVGAPADTTLMENDHPVSLGSDNKSIPSLASATEKMGHSIHLVESAASEHFFRGAFHCTTKILIYSR